jgi:hypothetical protein
VTPREEQTRHEGKKSSSSLLAVAAAAAAAAVHTGKSWSALGRLDGVEWNAPSWALAQLFG